MIFAGIIVLLLGVGVVLFYPREQVERPPLETDLLFQHSDGDLQALVSPKAKVTLVNFWATWCPPCIQELPSIERLYTAYKDKGLDVVGINLDPEPKSAIQRTRENFSLTFTLGTDPSQILVDRYDIVGIPVTIFLDSKGEPLLIERGGRDWNSPEVRKRIDQWLSL